MTVRSMMPLVALIAVTAIAAGCGDDEASSAEVTTSSLSKAAFVKKANRICGRGLQETQKGAAEQNGAKNEAQALAIASVPAFRKVGEQIQAMGAPAGDEEQIEAFLEALEEGLDTVEERQASISSTEQLESPLSPAGKLATAYGFSACGFGA